MLAILEDERLASFRSGAAVALVYEDRTVQPRVRGARRTTDEQSTAFVQQELGMVQLTLWLALIEEGLATSLRHRDWLFPDGLTPLAGLDAERFALAAVLPIGQPHEPPRLAEHTAGDAIHSHERYDPVTNLTP